MHIPLSIVAGEVPPLLLVSATSLLVGVGLSAFINNPTSYLHSYIELSANYVPSPLSVQAKLVSLSLPLKSVSSSSDTVAGSSTTFSDCTGSDDAFIPNTTSYGVALIAE